VCIHPEKLSNSKSSKVEFSSFAVCNYKKSGNVILNSSAVKKVYTPEEGHCAKKVCKK